MKGTPHFHTCRKGMFLRIGFLREMLIQTRMLREKDENCAVHTWSIIEREENPSPLARARAFFVEKKPCRHT